MSQDSSDERDQRGFQVRDRRAGSQENESQRDETHSFSEKPGQPIPASPDAAPGINFASFILSLSTSVMVHLGVTENPISKQHEPDFEIARQEIYIIEMLKEKTKGNLNDEESRLIEDVLFHLRMVYVEATKKSGGM